MSLDIVVIIVVVIIVAFILWDFFTYSRISMSRSNGEFSFSVSVKVPKDNEKKAHYAILRRWIEFQAGSLNEETFRKMVEEDVKEYKGYVTRWQFTS